MCSSFIEAVESVVVEDVDCCRLLCTIESSCFVVAVESVVEAVESVVIILKLLIVGSYYVL